MASTAREAANLAGITAAMEDPVTGGKTTRIVKRTHANLDWGTSLRAVATHLGFSLQTACLDWLDTAQFRPFFVKLQEQKAEQPAITHAKLKHPSSLNRLSSIVERDTAAWTEIELSLVNQTPTPKWEPLDYAHAAILGVYFAATEAGGKAPDLNKYDLDAPNENLYRIVAAFAWARKTEYFAAEIDQSKFRTQREINKVLERPAHMKNNEATPQDDEATPQDDEPDHTILPISSGSTNLVHWSRINGKEHDASPEPMRMHSVGEYVEYASLASEVSSFFKFQDLGQVVREIWFRWKEGGMSFARPLKKEWSKAQEVNRAGVRLNLRIHSRDLRRHDDATEKVKTYIPLAVNDTHSCNNNNKGLIEENETEETIEDGRGQDYWALYKKYFETQDIAVKEAVGSDDNLAQRTSQKRHLSHDSRQRNQALQVKRHKSEAAHLSDADDERDDAIESGEGRSEAVDGRIEP